MGAEEQEFIEALRRIVVETGADEIVGALPPRSPGADLRPLRRLTAYGHFAIGGSDISTASGLCAVSRPNFVPRS